MALSSVSAGNEVQAANINQFKEHLEGGAGKTVAYLLRQTTGSDFIIVLGGNSTSRKFSMKDSDDAEIFAVNADGKVTAVEVAPTALTAPSSSSPAQTTAGQLVYDTTLSKLTVGNGSSRDTIGGGGAKLLQNAVMGPLF